MMSKQSFNKHAHIPHVTTGFYFPEAEAGKPSRVRVLEDQIYGIEHSEEEAEEGLTCYTEYEIASKEEFLADHSDFVMLTLAENSVNPKTDLYVHPDVIEFISYWPDIKPHCMLSILPDDITEYWDLDHEPQINDPRIMHVFVHNHHDNRFDGRYHFNKAYLKKMLETGEIPENTNICLADNLIDLDDLKQDLQGNNHARAQRFEAPKT